jgi:hypothetical protein
MKAYLKCVDSSEKQFIGVIPSKVSELNVTRTAMGQNPLECAVASPALGAGKPIIPALFAREKPNQKTKGSVFPQSPCI